MTLITPESIREAFNDSPAVVKTFIKATILSPRWQDVMANQHQPSSYYWVRITRASLLKHINEDNNGEKMTITELRKITRVLSEEIPELLVESELDKLPPFQSKYNKKETTDYIMFAVINGHASHDVMTRVFKQIDVTNELCEQWQVGRMFMLNSTDEHGDYDYVIDHLDRIDWETILRTKPVGRPRTKSTKKESAKNPVGRPRKSVDPFKNSTPPAKRRTTLKKLGEQLDRIESNQRDILDILNLYQHKVLKQNNI